MFCAVTVSDYSAVLYTWKLLREYISNVHNNKNKSGNCVRWGKRQLTLWQSFCNIYVYQISCCAFKIYAILVDFNSERYLNSIEECRGDKQKGIRSSQYRGIAERESDQDSTEACGPKGSIADGWLRHTCIIQSLFFPITCKTLEE